MIGHPGLAIGASWEAVVRNAAVASSRELGAFLPECCDLSGSHVCLTHMSHMLSSQGHTLKCWF